MEAFRVITLAYGEPLPCGAGAYDHPDGGSAALYVEDVFETYDRDEANEFAVERSYAPNIQRVVVGLFTDRLEGF